MTNTITINGKRSTSRRTTLNLVLTSAFMGVSGSYAFAGVEPDTSALITQAVVFSPAFIQGNKNIDTSLYSKGNPLAAGVYRVDIYLNRTFIERTDIQFNAVAGSDIAQPCISAALLDKYGVDVSKLGADAKSPSCVDLAKLIPDATNGYDSSTYRLDLSIPQIALRQRPHGMVDPEQWDNGVTAAFLNYNVNAYRTSGPTGAIDQSYLSLDGGLNVGDWRLRHRGSLQWTDDAGHGSKRTWTNLDTYAQRDITSWRSQITFGDSSTNGDYFDSIGVRGVQLASSDAMLPDSQRGFAPVVRGTANSNARVSIRQNNQLIYETTVAPGAFEITDLNPTSLSGDLTVTVTEADGSQHVFIVPNAAVPQSLRPGVTRYAVSAGQVHNNNLAKAPYLMQAGAQHGLTNLVTTYGGIAATSHDYAAVMAGAALNTEYGALGFDLTGARTALPGADTQQGMSGRISYSKTMSSTDTVVGLAAYRYSTEGYFSLNDALTAYDTIERGKSTADTYHRPRNRLQLSLNQPLGQGQVYVSGSAQNYWKGAGSDATYQAGYGNSFHGIGYTASVQRSDDGTGKKDNRIFLSLSVPLGNGGSGLQSLNTSVAYDQNGGANAQALLSGSALADNSLGYNLNAGYDNTSAAASTVGAGVQYVGGIATVNGNVSHSTGYNQASAGLSGSVVAHRGGVTLSPAQLNTSSALVYAPGAEGAAINGMPGAKVDSFGYAIVPNLVAYRANVVTLDPKGTDPDIEFKNTQGEVVPRSGAISRIEFETVAGRTIILRTHMPDGSPLPFGVSVLDEQGTQVGVVGQAGSAFVRGVADKGKLSVHLGKGKMCTLSYQLDPKVTGKAANAQRKGFETHSVVCEPQAPVIAMRSGLANTSH